LDYDIKGKQVVDFGSLIHYEGHIDLVSKGLAGKAYLSAEVNQRPGDSTRIVLAKLSSDLTYDAAKQLFNYELYGDATVQPAGLKLGSGKLRLTSNGTNLIANLEGEANLGFAKAAMTGYVDTEKKYYKLIG
jgi:hypothetical protein